MINEETAVARQLSKIREQKSRFSSDLDEMGGELEGQPLRETVFTKTFAPIADEAIFDSSLREALLRGGGEQRNAKRLRRTT